MFAPTTFAVALIMTVLCCLVFNTYLMKKPIVGEPLTFSEYLKTRSSYHALGLIGGAIWGVGTVFNFVAASLVGVAISYAIGQASPMIAALWRVFLWQEFRGANRWAKLISPVCCIVCAGTVSNRGGVSRSMRTAI